MEEKRELKDLSKMQTGKKEAAGGNQEARLEQLMVQLKEAENEKKEYARRQYYMSAVTAGCSVLVLVLLVAAYLTVIPRVKNAFQEIQVVTENLNEVSNQLAEADLNQLVKNVDRMAVTSEKGVQEALEKIQAIDIDELNQAIKGLSDVVSPFAKFMNRFGG